MSSGGGGREQEEDESQFSQGVGNGAGNRCSGWRSQCVQRPWSRAVGDIQEMILFGLFLGFSTKRKKKKKKKRKDFRNCQHLSRIYRVLGAV